MAHTIEYPCPNCNSELNFDSESQNLRCLHCNTQIPIASGVEVIEEHQISEYFQASHCPVNELQSITYRCSKCGKDNISTQDIAFFECRYCGNNVINTEAYRTKPVVPASMVPFEISKEEALNAFQAWIGKGFWNDSDLKKMALNDAMQGYYVPFWTFDSQTESKWSGDSGRYYYVDVTYTDSQGKSQVRQERRTDWTYRSGHFSHFFDDVLISASKEFNQEIIREIYPFHLNSLKPYHQEYLLGWSAKAYDEDMTRSYSLFRQYIDGRIEQACEELLREDTFRNLSVETEYSKETFKHMLLPVWHCQYLFKGKPYFYIVNGQTGKIYGKKPLSVTKITIAVIIAIILIVLLILAVS